MAQGGRSGRHAGQQIDRLGCQSNLQIAHQRAQPDHELRLRPGREAQSQAFERLVPQGPRPRLARQTQQQTGVLRLSLQTQQGQQAGVRRGVGAAGDRLTQPCRHPAIAKRAQQLQPDQLLLLCCSLAVSQQRLQPGLPKGLQNHQPRPLRLDALEQTSGTQPHRTLQQPLDITALQAWDQRSQHIGLERTGAICQSFQPGAWIVQTKAQLLQLMPALLAAGVSQRPYDV